MKCVRWGKTLDEPRCHEEDVFRNHLRSRRTHSNRVGSQDLLDGVNTRAVQAGESRRYGYPKQERLLILHYDTCIP